ncbi:MAG: hypothetical protein H0W96_02950 [Solirubrobacterales bacterium]|nr:hypothetical protein [Solirubrobacterales bacterium]
MMTTATTGSTRLQDCRAPSPTTVDQCKLDGWRSYADAAGKPFRSERDCVKYVTKPPR